MLRGAQLDELHRACHVQARIHPHATQRERMARWAIAPCVSDEAAMMMSPFVMRARLLLALPTRLLATYTLTEQAGALEFVMGALVLCPSQPVVMTAQREAAGCAASAASQSSDLNRP